LIKAEHQLLIKRVKNNRNKSIAHTSTEDILGFDEEMTKKVNEYYNKGYEETLLILESLNFFDKNDRKYYERDVKHLIDNKQIVYIGELGHDDKVKLLKNAFMTVHPVTWPEPFGLVMAESMACGTPVLALSQGSIPEVVKDNVSGFVENDIDALIKRVKEVETIDRTVCRKHVEDNFSAEKMTEGYLSVYRKIIGSRIKSLELSSL